jgi:protein involved in polysaccharide export with SLBB domain
VNHPGEFEIKAEMKLSEAILLSEGFRGDAYMDRALIIRELQNYELQTIPFSPAEVIAGSFDVLLLEEDLIKVQSVFDLRENFKLTIQGEVRSSGQYPYTEGMVVEDLIYLAGGFKESAARSFVEVARRIVDAAQDQASVQVAEIYNFDITEQLSLSLADNNFELKPFDVVVIRRSPVYEKQTVIEIEGEVTFPGKYVLEKRDERISDVLKRAKGLTGFAYAQGATLIRRTEYYTNPDDEDMADKTSTASRIRKSELQELFEKDTLVNANEQKFKAQESIGINLPNILLNPGGEEDLILKEGDVLSIPRELQTVRIRGEVLYPSTVRFQTGASFKKFISQAGGFSDQAQEKKAYVIYANGSAEKTGSIFGFRSYPKVRPGAEIIIPSKPEKRKLSPGEIISIATGLGTMAVIVNSLTR